jgi:DNA (cytosine-5)-methyltransferase 1
MSPAYYNENNPYAAEWLKNLIDEGHLAPGYVDERDIRDVRSDDLAGFTQCHFFAGIGVWSYALRQAGWPDDRPIWTGSCPCQPFSGAGRRKGFDDERHLWPAWFKLIRDFTPECVIGEQVASPDGYAWLDLVQADMEGAGHAFGAVISPAAGFGAPHGRHRTYWLAHAQGIGGRKRLSEISRTSGPHKSEMAGQGHGYAARTDSSALRMAHAMHAIGRSQHIDCKNGRHGENRGWQKTYSITRTRGKIPELAHAHGRNASPERQQRSRKQRLESQDCSAVDGYRRPGSVNGYWRNADWLGCTDGKWRPVEPGTFPLAHGLAGRVGQLRAYGNAICAPQAIAFCECVIEVLS